MKKENQEKNAEISARISDIIECCATTPNNFAKILGYTRAQTIYDILNGKNAPSYDFFRRFSESEYSAIINLKWLLSGDADMWTEFWQKLPFEVQIEVANKVNHNVSVSSYRHAYTSNHTANEGTEINGRVKERAAMADMFYNKTLEQAEIIGQLKARIRDLETHLEKNAQSANTGDTANVG